MLLCCNLEVFFQHVKQYSEKQYVQASEHACQEFRNLVDYLVKKFSYVALHQHSCLNCNFCTFNFGNSLDILVTIKWHAFDVIRKENSFQNHDNFLICLCFPFLTRFFFFFRNVELQQTYMPESLSRIKDYDMTCVAQFPLKKKHAPEEPKCRADILVYVAKDIIHVNILSILTASDTKTKALYEF